jgi:hypothetical protein
LDFSRTFPEAPEYPAQEKYQAHLLEQYKLYVEMADPVSIRRQTTNSYFLSINTALLAFDGYLASKDLTANLWLIGCAGIVLSVLWFQIIASYRDLNSAKFKVLGEIEAIATQPVRCRMASDGPREGPQEIPAAVAHRTRRTVGVRGTTLVRDRSLSPSLGEQLVP